MDGVCIEEDNDMSDSAVVKLTRQINKRSKVRLVWKVICYLHKPYEWFSEQLNRIIPHKKKHSQTALGLIIGFSGVALTNVHILPDSWHILWDFLTVTLHAIGIIPLIKIFEPLFD